MNSMEAVDAVTPFAGVWIEITVSVNTDPSVPVTPFAGVWIEIHTGKPRHHSGGGSLPLRECGLKLNVC